MKYMSYKTACSITTGTNYTTSLTCSIGDSVYRVTYYSNPNGWSERDVSYFSRMSSDSPYYMDTSIEITDDTWKRWRLKARLHNYRAKYGKDPYTGRILTTYERMDEVALAKLWSCWL